MRIVLYSAYLWSKIRVFKTKTYM